MDATATIGVKATKEVMHNVRVFLFEVHEFVVYDILFKTTVKSHQMIN